MSEAVDLQSGQIASMSERLCCCGDIPKGSVSETVRATLPSALNVINASSVGNLVQLVTASRLILNHEGRVDPMKDECHYQIKH